MSFRAESKQDFIKLCSKGSLKQALQGFLPNLLSDHPNLFSHLLHHACCCIPNLRFIKATNQFHAFIITSSASFNQFTPNHLLHMYSKLGHLKKALTLFSTMPRKNIMSSNILIGGFICNDDLLIDEMPERNLASWNAMVTGVTHFGFDEEGLYLFAKMREEGFRPDEFSLASVL